VAYCFSPGVGNVATFEQDCISRGIPCFLADWSVDSPLPYLQGYSFLKKFVGAYNDERTITIDDWVNTCLPVKPPEVGPPFKLEFFIFKPSVS